MKIWAKWILALAAFAQISYAQGVSGRTAPSITLIAFKNTTEVSRTISDSQGNFTLTLPPGDYLIKAGGTSTPVSITGKKLITVNIEIPTASSQPAFFDEPKFTVAGVTDNTYRGGHGSDAILRSSETLARATTALSPSSTPDAAETIHTQAEREEKLGHPMEAVRQFQKAAEANPSERNIFDWGTELLAHQAPDAAAEIFSRGVNLFPMSTRMLLALATAYYTSGSYEQARDYFFKAIDLNPDAPTPYAFLNSAEAPVIKLSPGTLSRFAKFASLHPESALANYYYGLSAWKQSKTTNPALSSLQKSLAIDRHLAPAYLVTGIILASQGSYQESIKAFRSAIAEAPDILEAHYRLAESYRLTGNPIKAAEELSTYKALSEKDSAETERRRRELQQFVIALKEKSN